MYTRDGKYYSEDTSVFKNIIGMSLEGACMFCKSLNYWPRVYCNNGKGCPMGADSINNRINLNIVDGKVKNYYIG